MKSVPPISRRAGYGYIPCFDGLRAAAIIAVILRHFEIWRYAPSQFSVSVFFFISGVLITRLLIAEHEAQGRIDLFKFYTRRFVRLMPPLVLMVGLTAAVLLLTGHRFPPLSFLSSLCYFRNYYSWWVKVDGLPVQTPLWEQTWSLAVEEHFYLLFPLLLSVIGIRSRYGVMALVVPCVASLVLRTTYYFLLPFPDHYCYHATEARLDAILTGCLLSYAVHRHSSSRLWDRVSQPWIFYVCVLALPITILIREGLIDVAVKYSIQQALLFFVMFHLMFVDAHGWIKGLLELGALRYVGRLSYSLYLWHQASQHLAIHWRHGESGPVAQVLALILCFAASACSYHLLEMPLVNLRRRYGAHVPTQATPAEAPLSVPVSGIEAAA